MANFSKSLQVNVSTGEVVQVDLTPEQIAEYTQRIADEAARAAIPKPFLDYCQVYLDNMAIWVKILKALDDNRATFVLDPVPTGATILANLKAQINAAVAVVATAPAGVQNALIQERILEGSLTPEPLNATVVNAMTVGELRIVLDVLQKASIKGIALAAAMRVATLDNGS